MQYIADSDGKVRLAFQTRDKEVITFSVYQADGVSFEPDATVDIPDERLQRVLDALSKQFGPLEPIPCPSPTLSA